MSLKQGDLALLQHPVSQELLQSKIPARLAYIWTDGTPRVSSHLVSLERTRDRNGDAAQSAEVESPGRE